MSYPACPATSSSERTLAKQTRPIRVAFLIDRLSRAGTEIQLLALIHSLNRSRVLPWLVLLDGNDADSQHMAPTDCPVLRLGVKSLASRRAMKAAFRLACHLRSWQIDVVQTYFIDSTLFGVPVARWAGVPWVIRVRNNLGYWKKRWHRWLDRRLQRWINVTLTNSIAGQDQLCADGIAPDRIRVLENGVDVERFRAPPPRFSDRIRIGTVANLRPVKGLDLLVRAARPLVDRHPNLTFEVAGEGPERSVLEELIRSYNLESHFFLRGAVSDIPGFLAELDIAVLPSRSESMSNALLEAMAAGRAIVATRVGAASQLIRPGVDGLLIEPESIPALVEAIDYLVRHAEESRNMGMSARERVTAHHSRKVMCHRFEQFYEELVWGDGRTGPVLLNSTAPVHCEPIGGV